MARTIARLVIDVSANIGTFAKNMRAAQNKLDRFARRADRIGQKLFRSITLPLQLVTIALLKFASDMVESENLFEVAMKDMADEARVFSERLRTELGLNSIEVRKQVAVMFQMTESMGLSQATAFDLSKGIVQLSADMASFRNIRPEEAFQKLQSGLIGNVRPLRDLGIDISALTIDALGLELGIRQTGGEFTNQQKILLRYIAIVRATRNDQGDLEATMDTFANVLRRVQSTITQVAAEMGVRLIPAFTSVGLAILKTISAIKVMADLWEKLPKGVRTSIIAFITLVTIIGPLVFIIGKIVGLAAGLIGLLGLLVTPIGLVAAAIGLIVVGGIALIRHWTEFKNFTKGLWLGIQLMVLLAADNIIIALQKMLSWIPGVGAAFEAARDVISKALSETLTAIIAHNKKMEDGAQDTGKAAAATNEWTIALDDALAALRQLDLEAGLAGQATKVAEALAAMKEEFRVLSINVQLFGAQAVDPVTERLRIFEAALKSLVAAGLGAADPLVVELAASIRVLRDEITSADAALKTINEAQSLYNKLIAESQSPLEKFALQQEALFLLMEAGKIDVFELMIALGMLAQKMEDIKNINLGQTLQQELIGSIVGISKAVGQLFLNLSAGMKGFLSSIGALLGQVMQNLGRALIAFGIAGLAIKKFIISPGLAIAAGAALIALGSALSGAAQGIVNAGLTGGGGAAVTAVPSSDLGRTEVPDAPVIIYLENPDGTPWIMDPNNPRSLDQFKRMMESVSGRRIIINPDGGSGGFNFGSS